MSPRKRLPYKILKSRQIYKGSIVEFVKDDFVLHAVKNKVITRVLLRHPGAVVILPFVDKNHIILLKQFRYAAQGDLWEIPAGTIEKGEKPLVCAKREIQEETGMKAARWKFLTQFYLAPGISNEIMFLFAASNLKLGKKNLDHDEFIEHEIVSIAKATQMISDGRIRDAKTIASILWACQFPISI